MIPIAASGTTDYVIALDKAASRPERHAAEELAGYLKQITGARFSIVAPAGVRGRPAIAVGAAAAVVLGLPLNALRGLGDEGFVMRTLASHLILSGAPLAPRGTLYAVYTFLEEILGCRWWTPAAAFVPKRPTLTVQKLGVRKIPFFEYREALYRQRWETHWSVRNRTNGLWEEAPFGIPPDWGGHHQYAGFVHTLVGEGCLVDSREFPAHPDWFAEVDGKRTVDQLCLSHPAVLERVIANVRIRLRKDPLATIVSVSQNDNHIYCRCRQCHAVDRREGSPSGSLLRFVNAVAAAIEKEFPRVSVDTLAYLYSRKPPRHMRPRHNVIVRLCSFECDFLHPLDHVNNRAFFRDLKGWSRVCSRLYVWDYVTNYAHFVMPHPNWYILADNLRLFHAHGVRGVFEQANNSSLGGEMAELRAWVLAKLLWDPARDIYALIHEFLSGYYGKAAPHLDQYMRRVHATAMNVDYYAGSQAIRDCLTKRGYPQAAAGCYLDLNAQPDAPFLAPDVVLEGLRHMQAAAAAVAGDRALVARIALVRLPLWYVCLLRWDELRRHARRTGQAWLLPATRMAAFRAFARVYAANGITHLGEGWSKRTLPWLKTVCQGRVVPW